MIKQLFLYDIKENRMIIIAFTLIFMLYGSISISMFDPESTEILQNMLDLLPESVIRVMGFDNLGGDMTHYLSNYLYGFIYIIFPMIFSIMIGTKLIAKHVDRGSMNYLITMPYTRTQIVVTQLVFFLSSFLLMIVINVGVMLLMSELMFSGLLDIPAFLKLNLITILVHFLMMGICFIFSVVFSDASYSTGVSSGILVFFFVMQMLHKISDKTDFMKYFSPYALIQVKAIIEVDFPVWIWTVVLVIVSISIYILAIQLFQRKNIII